jgi:FkbM family methyltransferase
MNLKTLSRDLWLLANFRNGWKMVRYLRGYSPVFQAELFNRLTIVHPPKAGLVESILEIWFEKAYFPKGFYIRKPKDIIVDVGANIGLFTIQAALKNPDAQIIAFEPFPENFDCLAKNINTFRLEQVSLYQYAISSSQGHGLISVNNLRSLDCQLILGANSTTEVQDYKNVKVLTLDNLLNMAGIDKISLLKMDIEGSELDVFSSISEQTLKRLFQIALEYHDNLRAGTLRLIQEKLASTHYCKVFPSNVPGCGLIFAIRKH